MEVPSMDDNMEMASPYQGHADDFEIDIDVMEDQASNPDRDMSAVDEDMDNSHDIDREHDGSPDEDMLDDEAEPSMVDADDYAEADQTVDETKTYEAEMLEDDYDEDIDAPVPESELEVPASFEHATNEEGAESLSEKKAPEISNESPVEPQPEAGTNYLDETQNKPPPVTEQAADDLDGKKPVEESETAHVEPRHPEDSARDTNEVDEQTPQTEPQTTHSEHQEPSEDLQKPDQEDGDLDKVQSSNDDRGETEVDLQKEQSVAESSVQKAEQDHESIEDTSLHPVKVYYQQNEISLFPPREGDSSETFFLEDEGFAYENFGTLFGACREVLQSHIVDNEVLIIDIEALGFQLTEDMRETYSFNLKQIVDVYLQLCHNDGIEEPEALYLTLTTKRTAAEELSELMLAASEGKGLSEIQAWEVYPDAEDAAEYEDLAQKSYPEENEGTLDHQGKTADPADPELKPSSHDQDASNSQEDDQVPQANRSSENVDIDEHTIEAADPEGVNVTSVDAESPHAATHNSEEQNTESTGTIQPLPSTDASEERPESGEIAEDDYDKNEDEDEYHEEYRFDGEAHPEDGSLLPATGSADNLDEPLTDYAQHQGEEHLEEYHDLESGYDEQPILRENEPAASQHTEIKPDTAQDDEGVDDSEVPQDSPKAAEPVLDEYSPEQSHQAQDVVNDSPNVAEEFSNSKDEIEASNAIEHGEVDDTAEGEGAFSLHPENDDKADLPFEEEDYLDLGIEDDLSEHDEDQDIASTDHVSGKRLREPEDEHDLPESTTPEVKRSRSS
ncbi:uncharacterized protein BDV17DRAFT_8686 [Aspergillus undulatus]|uniref:uncharacterized protein n=1 Tax=Aspergillus undulatus TaxID=1810928 RepID=UPI003CCD7D48